VIAGERKCRIRAARAEGSGGAGLDFEILSRLRAKNEISELGVKLARRKIHQKLTLL